MDIKPLEWIAKSSRIIIPSTVIGLSFAFGGSHAIAQDGPKEIEIEIEGEEGKKEEPKKEDGKKEEGKKEDKDAGKEEGKDGAEGEAKKPEYHAFPVFGSEIDANEERYVPELGNLRSKILEKIKGQKDAPDGELVSYKFLPGKDKDGRDAVLLEIHYKKDGKDAIYSVYMNVGSFENLKNKIDAGAKKAQEVQVEKDKGVVERMVLKREISDYTDMAVDAENVYLKFKNIPGFKGNGLYELSGKLAADYCLRIIFEEESLMGMKPEERNAKVAELRKLNDNLAKVRIGVKSEGKEYFLELHYVGSDKPEIVPVSEESVARFIERMRRSGQWRQLQEEQYKQKGRALKQKDDHSNPESAFGKRDNAKDIAYGQEYTWSELKTAGSEDADVQYAIGLIERVLNSDSVVEKEALQVKNGTADGKKVFYFRAGDKDTWHELNVPQADKFNAGYEKLVSNYKPAEKKEDKKEESK